VTITDTKKTGSIWPSPGMGQITFECGDRYIPSVSC
jgi:hypothetical protein